VTPPPAPTDIDIDRLRLVLVRIARRIRTSSVEELTPSQLTVLATIERNGRVTVGQIADLEHVKPPSVSKIVAALEHLGFVAREPDERDRRCVFIAATPEGTAYLDTVRAAGRTWLASRLAELDDGDLGELSAVLPILERLLEAPE